MSAKKASKPAREAATYAVSDIVLGKVRGYPPWPGMVIDPETVPASVAAQRPGKKTQFYCVRFFPNNDHAWLVEKDISRLKPHEIDAFVNETSKKKGDLYEGYKIARNPEEWLKKKAKEAEEEADDDAEADEVDQLESESGGDKKGTAKKRKRDAESASAKTKKAATKKDAETTSGKKKATGKKGAKSKATVESEDEAEHGRSASGAEDAGPSRKESPPAAKKLKRDKEAEPEDAKEGDPESLKVRDWRHKLQKTFLSNKALPKHDDIPDLDTLFTQVEQCEITIAQLQFSKIGKVMRHIAALQESKVLRDAEYKFRERAKALVEKWQAILTSAKQANGDESPSKETLTAPPTSSKKKDMDEQANGDVKDADAPGEKDEDGQSVTQATSKIDLNGKGAQDTGATAEKISEDVVMADA